MIVSSVYARDDAGKYPASIQRAIEYVKSQDFTKLEPGDYPIDGDRIYAKVFDLTSKPVEKTKPEVHKKYIDVQFWVCGEELVGFAALKEDYRVSDFVEEQDLYFLEGVKDESFIKAVKGDYMIFFPNDCHRPGVMIDTEMTYRKVVVKVHVDTLAKD